MIRRSLHPEWLTKRDLWKLFAVAIPVAMVATATLAAQQDGLEAFSSVFTITGSFLMASFSLGRLWGDMAARMREVDQHRADDCVMAGAHVEGCIFAEGGAPTVMVNKEGKRFYEGLTKTQLSDQIGKATGAYPDPGSHTKQELLQMHATVTNDTPEDEVLSTEISMCMECGNLLDDSRDQRRHQGKQVDRCLQCGKHGLCFANPDGPHERIVWPEDPDYDPGKHLVGPLPDAVRRVGYCPECRAEFREVGDGFTELTWEDVGFLWAAESNPELLEQRRVEGVCTSVVFGPPQDPSGFWFGFDIGDKVGYHFIHRAPLVRGDLLWTMLHTMGRQDNEGYDDDDLRIQLPRREEKGRFRLTLNKANDIVDIAALPCENCERIHPLEHPTDCGRF